LGLGKMKILGRPFLYGNEGADERRKKKLVLGYSKI